ncbi:hypothetical protein BaRGS_00018688, partial [Batillaria attramentaria]
MYRFVMALVRRVFVAGLPAGHWWADDRDYPIIKFAPLLTLRPAGARQPMAEATGPRFVPENGFKNWLLTFVVVTRMFCIVLEVDSVEVPTMCTARQAFDTFALSVARRKCDRATLGSRDAVGVVSLCPEILHSQTRQSHLPPLYRNLGRSTG